MHNVKFIYLLHFHFSLSTTAAKAEWSTQLTWTT